jgi:hypothetical protein
MCVAPKRLNFRMRIPSDFRKDWGLFNKRCKVEGMTPADLLQDLIEEYLDEFREEMEKAAGELAEVAGPLRDAPPKKVTIRKPKKKSFLARKTPDMAPQANAILRASHGSLPYCSAFLIDLRYIYAGMNARSDAPINAVISLIRIIVIIRINKRTHCLTDNSQPAVLIVLLIELNT